MIYIKFILLIFIVLICSYIGFIKSNKYKYRTDEISIFLDLMYYIKSRIEFTSEPIKEVLREYKLNKDPQIEEFIIKLTNEDDFRKHIENIDEDLDKIFTNLSIEDKRIIKKLFSVLGTTGKQNQLSYIELAINQLKRQKEEALIIQNKNVSLFRKIGVISGLAFSIILL